MGNMKTRVVITVETEDSVSEAELLELTKKFFRHNTEGHNEFNGVELKMSIEPPDSCPTTEDRMTELTLETVKSYLDKKYNLVYIEQRDRFEDKKQLKLVQKSIQEQDWIFIDEDQEDWLMDARYQGYDYARDELIKEVAKGEDISVDDVKSFLETDDGYEIQDIIYERDESNPVLDLCRNTGELVFYYDTGMEVYDLGFDEESKDDVVKGIKDTFSITDDSHDEDIYIMLSQSQGGQLVVYFTSDIEPMMEVQGMNRVEFKNAHIAIVDHWNGSGDSMELDGVKFSLPFDPKNLFIDKCIKYNYTYEVCGMDDSWCASTRFGFYHEDGQDVEVKVSSTHQQELLEDKYDMTYRNGSCTNGDMDVNRHRNTFYRNDYPCGTHCPNCGTFWID